MSHITHWVRLSSNKASVDGHPLSHVSQGSALLVELYKSHVGDYPKFYKMDPLCRAGFIASELLLEAEGKKDSTWADSRAVLLFNRTASIADDSNYQETINTDTEDSFFPSPSLFVYTLPNVLTGEIAIRNHYYGETSFVVLPNPDPFLMREMADELLLDPNTDSILTGWADCTDADNFDILLYIIRKS